MAVNFKAIFVNKNGERIVIGTFNEREKAVNSCIEYRGNYCLDNERERRECLEVRDFYVLGCGPEEFLIEED